MDEITVPEAAFSGIVGTETFAEVTNGRFIDDVMWPTVFVLVLFTEEVILGNTASETKADTRL